MEQREGSFFDPKTILAIVLVGGVWFAWQTYLTKKYPDYGKAAPVSEQSTDNKTKTTDVALNATTVSKNSETSKLVDLSKPSNFIEKTIHFENDFISTDVSSRGLGFSRFTLKKFKNRENTPVVLGSSANNLLFELRIGDESVPFEIESPADSSNLKSITGVAKIGDMVVRRTLVFSDSYGIRSEVSIINAPLGFKGFQVLIPEVANTTPPGSIFAPATEIQEFVYGSAKNFERINTHGNENIEKSVGFFDVAAVSSHYFVSAIANESEIVPEVDFVAKVGEKEVFLKTQYRPTNLTPDMKFVATLFAGPKDLETLQSVSTSHSDLTPIVNFGFFGQIGKILLKILRFFYNFTIPNWGVAIIFLTLLVRALVLPFNLASFKSMKKMQIIQPQITSLRERYKDDPNTLNAEMMKLMKDQKVNPIGGCLPMLLQMPVFFALYQVLGQSIDLYQAPFFGWIHDLSLKDPYFVLPILMGAAMWYNQKITPTTMDPTQAKVMQFLPLVFSFMMIALPSGLTLYIFVSTLFGIIQQQIFMKDRKPLATAQ